MQNPVDPFNMPYRQNVYCSFCGRPISPSDMALFGINKNTCICQDCIKLADEITAHLKKQEAVKQPAQTVEDNPKISKKYSGYSDYTPSKIKAFLDEYIIGQDIAKRRIAVAIYNHYKRISRQTDMNSVEIDKSNILLTGPTGTGKTLIARTIARLLDVPFAIIDATSLTEAGYVGDDVENCITRLLQACDYDVEKAERGIVYIDEIDKIAARSGNPSISRDVSGEGVQQALLKIVEGTDVDCPANGGRKHPDAKKIRVNTKNILFIAGGAFDGIDIIIKSRNNKGIGFNVRTDNKKETSKIPTAADIKKYGIIPELVGRFPVITATEALDKDTLKKILTEPKNAIIKQYKELLNMDGVTLAVEDQALDRIASAAIEYGTGARGLRSIMEDIMDDIMYNIPDSDKKRAVITLKYVNSKLEDRDAA